ncbi:Rrf2 family transcriptional regulator [Thermotoga neapolitana]|uniref:Rrf2 family transcriptional regulator n=1 Tax=Thermotoga neapolitana TaxID=2337 RepID=UPI001E374172|nr:Rrf2 family transcriptional regulator [Thermotoga neapolitana]
MSKTCKIRSQAPHETVSGKQTDVFFRTRRKRAHHKKFHPESPSLSQKICLVSSIKGKNGGFVLARSADEISFLDIIRAFEKDLVIVDCSNRCENYKHCRAKYFWSWLSDHLKEMFSSITLKDIASGSFAFQCEKLP